VSVTLELLISWLRVGFAYHLSGQSELPGQSRSLWKPSRDECPDDCDRPNFVCPTQLLSREPGEQHHV